MKIVTTSINKPPKICVYGPPGVGKSRFAASFPNPIFLRTEDRHDHLSVPTSEGIILTVDRMVEDLNWLLTEEHDRKTVVIDTADSFEMAVQNKVCEGTGTTDILHPKIFPFYSGFVKAAKIWEGTILRLLCELNEKRKMMPVIISHVRTEYVEHPDYGSYPKFVPGVDKRVGAKIFKICDIVGFLDWETMAKGKEEDVKRLSTSGQRILRLKPKPIWETKESYNLPEELQIPEESAGEYRGYEVLKKAIAAGLRHNRKGDLAEIASKQEEKKMSI
ncbi:AAA domain containing protein [uncultured Caudovirales phage]|uniref:AAA domain containing protein n=1 Tax=uncultured Caudovirales phage TaxID=2100421 RepID=A0A6J5N1H2_9CAUD|nr:AAA domain containing protein [uncultured Caudovirales phage]